MWVSFYVGKQSDVDHNTTVKLLEWIDDDGMNSSELMSKFGYPTLHEILDTNIYKMSDAASSEKIMVAIVVSHGGEEFNKLFVRLLTILAKKTTDSHINDLYFINRELRQLGLDYPQINVSWRGNSLFTMEIEPDMLAMLVNILGLEQ
jgi:hypothetical protein